LIGEGELFAKEGLLVGDGQLLVREGTVGWGREAVG
jgi:hypothetical protein